MVDGEVFKMAFPFCKDKPAIQHQAFCPSSSFTSSNIITLSHLFLLSINHPFSWREAGILSDNDTPCMPSLNIQPCSSSQFYIVHNNSRHADGISEIRSRGPSQGIHSTQIQYIRNTEHKSSAVLSKT